MRKDKVFLSFFNWPLAFWRDFSCPLHDGCLLSLLEQILRELDSFPNWLMERPFRPLNEYYLGILVIGLIFI